MPRFVKLASLSDLPPGSAVEVDHEGRLYAIFHRPDGQLFAIDGICAHQGGPIADGEVDGTVVTCPWHGWRFDLGTGRSLIHKSVCLDVFEVKIEGEDVL